ncbi:MAG: hypothetical protein MJ050_03385, partial [Phascolarctobacterium sp.]|nr:hypothetical protein [Phascolarctobacterium sp.]
LGAKLGQKGALFVEYALILAFVLVVGAVFLSDGSLATNIKSIFAGGSQMVGGAADKLPDAAKVAK